MKLNEGAFFAIVFICFAILALGSISLDYWNTNQVRVTYQTAYQKIWSVVFPPTRMDLHHLWIKYVGKFLLGRIIKND